MQRNPVGWFEIYVKDMSRAVRFYQTVLNIQLSPLAAPVPELEMFAFPIEMQAAGASGALVCMKDGPPGGTGTIVYFSCVDCGEEASRVEAAGGRVCKPKMSIGQYGFIALVMDTENNMIGLHSLS